MLVSEEKVLIQLLYVIFRGPTSGYLIENGYIGHPESTRTVLEYNRYYVSLAGHQMLIMLICSYLPSSSYLAVTAGISLELFVGTYID